MKKRKLLLDSCVALAVLQRLRADGHDIVNVLERGADPNADDAGYTALHASAMPVATKPPASLRP